MSQVKFEIFRDTAVYSFSGWVSQILAFFLALYIRWVLGPEAMGIWALLQTFIGYIGYANLGMLRAVGREIPLARGQDPGNQEDIGRIKNAGLTYIVLSSAAMGMLLILGAFIFRTGISEMLFIGLIVIAFMNVLERVNNYAINLLYAEKRFVLAGRFRILSSLVNAVLVVFLVGLYGLWGMYGAVMLSYGFNLAYLAGRKAFAFELRVDFQRIRNLLKIGIPLFVVGVLTAIFTTLDKLAIAKFLGLEALGVYTLATLGAGYIILLPNNFQTVLYPSLLEKFGGRNEDEKWKYAVKPVRFVALYLGLALGLVWILSKPLVDFILPDYAGGLPALKMLIFGFGFFALSQPMANVLVARNEQIRMIPVLGGILGLTLAGYLISARLGGGLFGMALVASVGYLVHYLIYAFMALGLQGKLKTLFQEIGLHLLPLLLAMGGLLVLDGWTDFGTLVKSGLYLLLWSGLVLWCEPMTGARASLHEIYGAWKLRRTKVPTELGV